MGGMPPLSACLLPLLAAEEDEEDEEEDEEDEDPATDQPTSRAMTPRPPEAVATAAGEANVDDPGLRKAPGCCC